PVLHGARQQGRHAEVPEEHPDEQRDVTKELDVRGGGPAQRRKSHRAQRAREDSERHRHHPRQRRQLERGEQALDQPASRLAGPEHAPLEVIGHLNMGAPTWPPYPLTLGRAPAEPWRASGLLVPTYLPICFSRYARTCAVIGYGSSPFGPNHLSEDS